MVRREAANAGVDPALVAAVARTESGLDPAARSPAGAVGLMQLMPATATVLGVADPYDPAANVRAGAAYLRELLGRFGGNVPAAVAAYNAGPGTVERYGGVPPFEETRRYVARVMATMRAERER
jgi:soluble lytic murein transglycosylase-like protein